MLLSIELTMYFQLTDFKVQNTYQEKWSSQFWLSKTLLKTESSAINNGNLCLA